MPKYFVRAKPYSYVLKNKLQKSMHSQIRVYDGILLASKEGKEKMAASIEHKLAKLHELHPRCKKVDFYRRGENMNPSKWHTIYISNIGHISFYEVKKEVYNV